MKKTPKILITLAVLVLVVSFSIFCTIEINPETIGELLGGLREMESTMQDSQSQEDPQQTTQESPLRAPEEETEADAADPEDWDYEPMEAEEGWVDFAAFVKRVESARWSGVSPDCHDGTSLTTYDLEGTETIDGVSADKITGSFSVDHGDKTQWTLWVGPDGAIMQAVVNGEEADPSFYEMYKLMAVPPLAPFALPDPAFNREFKQVLCGQNVPGWELLSFERNADRVGGKNAYVCVASFKHESYANQTATFTHGDFGTFKILLETYLAYASSTMKTDSIAFR